MIENLTDHKIVANKYWKNDSKNVTEIIIIIIIIKLTTENFELKNKRT